MKSVKGRQGRHKSDDGVLLAFAAPRCSIFNILGRALCTDLFLPFKMRCTAPQNVGGSAAKAHDDSSSMRAISSRSGDAREGSPRGSDKRCDAPLTQTHPPEPLLRRTMFRQSWASPSETVTLTPIDEVRPWSTAAHQRAPVGGVRHLKHWLRVDLSTSLLRTVPEIGIAA